MSSQLPILTVSQLNRQVKGFLENEIGLVHVEGEISNLSKPSSGHYYFTLKDSTAQIRCAFFKNRHSNSLLRNFNDGQQIVATGKLSLYEARGEYQLIVEEIVKAGMGILYQRFEELKIKLASEGLFNPERKKPLPRIPETIGIITSPTGAAIQDILSTLARRFPIARIIIYPSEVQGQTAPQQLVKALKLANAHKRCQVLILARGGGSIEDLWAFNDEYLARQIAISEIPVVSGIGHETDFTIADFVADYRAETPTAAATAVTPNCIELFNILDTAIYRLHDAIIRLVKGLQLKLNHLIDKIASPRQTISTYWQTLDYLERQLISAMTQFINLNINK
ncbi:exodeoxyribonuclease VII large subunit, partial [Legionella pneumophila]